MLKKNYEFTDRSDELVIKCYELPKNVDEGKITEVELPEGLIKIPELLFSHCSKLTKVIIPSSVVTI